MCIKLYLIEINTGFNILIVVKVLRLYQFIQS